MEEQDPHFCEKSMRQVVICWRKRKSILGMDYGLLKPTTTSQHLAFQISLFVSGLWRCRLIDCPIAGTSDD